MRSGWGWQSHWNFFSIGGAGAVQTKRPIMPCDPEVLKNVPIFALLDNDEAAVLAAQVEIKRFSPRQRIYKMGEVGGRAYVLVSGSVRVTTLDEDNQEVLVHEPVPGEFFGFASMLDQTAHQTGAAAAEDTVCVEVDRDDIAVLLQQRPSAGMDILTVLGRHYHASQNLVRLRANRNANEIIESETTYGDRLADSVAHVAGSWSFIISFGVILAIYTGINVSLGSHAWDPYPFILLNLFLSMLAAIQAPVIMMSQNRQDTKDRVRSELDYDVNRRSEVEIRALSSKIHLLADKIDDVEDLLRAK
jgi:CRP/FNR family cyclic AMP-dependent transcriptional regulator